MNFKNSSFLTALALLALTALIFSASAKQGKIFRDGPKEIRSSSGVEPRDAKEVCMRLVLALERYCVDNNGKYPKAYQQVFDAGYIKFPSVKNLITGKQIKCVRIPGIPGDFSYLIVYREKKVVGYIMIVYGRPTDLTEDYDLDNNGKPDGVAYCFSEMALLSDEFLSDAGALKKDGFRLFESASGKIDRVWHSINLTKKPVRVLDRKTQFVP